jgi:hypothetical protein
MATDRTALVGRTSVEIVGYRPLMAKLTAINKKTAKDYSKYVQIIYEAPYAVYVHEDLEMPHAPPTQAKYLETAMKQQSKSGEMSRVITRHLKKGDTIGEAMKQSALKILEKSNELVPVDTGFLKESGKVVVKG